MKFINRKAEQKYNKYGTLMKIVEYNNACDIWVEFQDEHKEKVHTEYKHFKSGCVKNPYDKTVYNIGYLGKGEYEPKTNKRIYNIWKHMLRRCYDPYYINKQPTYIDCYVCVEWHNFQNFAKWYEENVYECNNEEMHLDKDILIKGNKIYSPETCIFVPREINNLFTKRQNYRGDCVIGVYYNKKENCYITHCNFNIGKPKHLGSFKTEKEAFLSYKQAKENYIKQVADEYKDLIPTKLYDALYKYKVEIND